MTEKRPYRVLLVDLAREYGGAEVRVLAQAAALQGVVAECRVAALAGRPLHQRLEREGLPSIPIEIKRSDPRMLLSLRNLIRRGGYQVIDAHNVQSVFWGHLAALLAGVPGRVTTIHSDLGAENPGLKGKGYETILWLDRLFVREVVNVTEVLQAKAEAQGLGKRATLIHNAVPIPSAPRSAKDAALLASWGFTPDDFIVAIIARLKPVKGHTYLIDAMAQLKDQARIKLLVVGDGPLYADLVAQVQRLGVEDRVHFTGFRQDVTDLLPSVDCVCMASLSEALPYAVLEAASYARPLVATAVGGMATLLQDDQTALMVPPANPAALAAAIHRLADDPRTCERLGQAAYDMVCRSFSVPVMIEKTLQVYDRAVK